MRASVYAGVSTALAGGVITYAFAQRPNFYSACVFLSQSNLSLMILLNHCLLIAFSVVWTLSRALYGPLRPIEVEQLYERGWFAVTETCLAMTMFREELGAWFITMFVALMAGRVWGWIGHGRVEILEQQPPANPRSFHTRLILSLLVSLAYDIAFLSYTADTVYEQARPNMMVMFLFEYVLSTISTLSTALRYLIVVIDIRINQKQTQEMLEVRRAEIRERRESMIRERKAREERGEATPGREDPLPSEDDVEEMDIEPAGWEGKGQMILILELVTDFIRLLVYLTFFTVLATFFSLPIHIMRDLFMTSRSFIKRLNAMLRYRNATRDMNAKYPDATAEEISDNDTCIICREEMKSWDHLNQEAERRVGANRPAVAVSERHRSKKLPCGHILHLSCLKSWLERQQVCPTCRAPVSGRTTEQTPAQPAAAPAAAPGIRPGAGAAGQPRPVGGGLPQPGGQQPPVPDNGVRGGMINLGPLRLAYGRAAVPGTADPSAAIASANQAIAAAHQAVMAQAQAQPGARVFHFEVGNNTAVAAPATLAGWRAAPSEPTTSSTLDIGELIRSTERRIMEEAEKLELQREDLDVLRRMQVELSRLGSVDREQREARQQVAAGAPVQADVPVTTADAARVETRRMEPTPPPVLQVDTVGSRALEDASTRTDGEQAQCHQDEGSPSSMPPTASDTGSGSPPLRVTNPDGSSVVFGEESSPFDFLRYESEDEESSFPSIPRGIASEPEISRPAEVDEARTMESWDAASGEVQGQAPPGSSEGAEEGDAAGDEGART